MTTADLRKARTMLADRLDRAESIHLDGGGVALTAHWRDGGQKLFYTLDAVNEYVTTCVTPDRLNTKGTDHMTVFEIEPVLTRPTIMSVLIETPDGNRKTVTALGQTVREAAECAERDQECKAMSVHVEGWIDVDENSGRSPNGA